jgi:hypothetical protein
LSDGAVDAADLRHVMTCYQNAPSELRKNLEVPIERLGQAVCEPNIVDQAIDLGVSLESLLLHNLGPERGELSYRFRLRGAALLGGTLEQKRSCMTLLGKIYGLRSRAVHVGQIQKHKGEVATIRDGLELCARLIRKVLELRAYPKWEDLVLEEGTT